MINLWKQVGYQLTVSELEQMSRYLDTMKIAIQSNHEHFIADLEAMAKDMSEEERSDFYDSYENEMIEVGSDFPALLFSSFVISWYSFMEQSDDGSL